MLQKLKIVRSGFCVLALKFCAITSANFSEMRLIWTAGIQSKLRCDHRSCRKNLGLQRDSNPWPLRVLALLYSINWAMKTDMLEADQLLPVTGMRRETAGKQMKLRCDHRSCNRNWSNCRFSARKAFDGFKEIWTHGLYVSTVVLYQLSYEDPSWPVYRVHLYPWQESDVKWG